MLRAIYVMTVASFQQLRRDQVFVPVVIMGFAIALFATLAYEWAIDGFEKVLFDIGLFGFYVTGIAVAIFWGSRLVIDSKKEGGMEIELAAPISRSSWVIGKSLGLFLTLGILTIVLLVIWQLAMVMTIFGWLKPHQLTVFGFLFLSWSVVAASAIFFSTFCSEAVAQFATACTWILGLAVDLISKTMLPDTAPILKSGVNAAAMVWDLQQFNLLEYATNPTMYSPAELTVRGLYGGGLILILITASCLVMNRRNIL